MDSQAKCWKESMLNRTFSWDSLFSWAKLLGGGFQILKTKDDMTCECWFCYCFYLLICYWKCFFSLYETKTDTDMYCKCWYAFIKSLDSFDKSKSSKLEKLLGNSVNIDSPIIIYHCYSILVLWFFFFFLHEMILWFLNLLLCYHLLILKYI